MNFLSKRILWAIAFAVAFAFADTGSVIAGGDVFGDWHPYSRPVESLGVMTVSSDRLSFATGLQARLERVRSGGGVYRVIEVQGDGFLGCGPDPANYVGFRVLDNGGLALLQYRADAPPAEPAGNDAMAVTRNGACSVMFYTR